MCCREDKSDIEDDLEVQDSEYQLALVNSAKEEGPADEKLLKEASPPGEEPSWSWTFIRLLKTLKGERQHGVAMDVKDEQKLRVMVNEANEKLLNEASELLQP